MNEIYAHATGGSLAEVKQLCLDARLQVRGEPTRVPNGIAVVVAKDGRDPAWIKQLLHTLMRINDTTRYEITFSEGVRLDASFVYFTPEVKREAASHE